ncbi:ATP-dependent DNA helicase [Fusibacter ferrireducens]|nr:ATP-dependent DNA helicase [Fusibacter ferrireducens]
MDSIPINTNTMSILNILKQKKIITEESKGLFILKDCLLYEQFTGKTYTYRLVNYMNGKQEYLFHRKKQIDRSSYREIALKIAVSDLFGSDYSRTGLAMIEYIFNKVFTNFGYVLRQEQVNLSKHMYQVMTNGKISMSDIPVGLGKTHAYLVAAIVFKMFHAKSKMKPIIISTSSIELQKAIIKDYIPDISKMLLAYGIIERPVTCIMRKGKDNYLCERRLKDYVESLDPDKKIMSEYVALTKLMNSDGIDLDEIEGISGYDRRKICVNLNNCLTCSIQSNCRYQKHMKKAKKSGHDLQICNHNYFLADVIRKRRGLSGLFPDYDKVVIDEAHKLRDAANQMYGTSISQSEIIKILKKAMPKNDDSTMKKILMNLCNEGIIYSNKFFDELICQIPKELQEEETEKYKTFITQRARVLLSQVTTNLEEIHRAINDRDRKLASDVRRLLRNMKVFNRCHIIYWLEMPYSKGQTILASVPITLSQELGEDLWLNDKSYILTSGTIAVEGDFKYIKNELGMNRIPMTKLQEISKDSPFNFKENCLLYISENTIYPDYDNQQYIDGLIDEIENLIRMSNGHALVLFTSYKPLRLVYQGLANRISEIPLYQMTRGRSDILDEFKASGNGVLFATGSMWEGVNIPGDILSHLIIVKLPFPIPDPFNDYERTCYKTADDYVKEVLVPQMLIKLRQGAGRLIRNETDSGVISILDSRASTKGKYHNDVIKALPKCRLGKEHCEINAFLKQKKPHSFFE